MKMYRKGIACEVEECYTKERRVNELWRKLFKDAWPASIPLSDTLYLFCDEDGLLKNLPLNFLIRKENLPLQPIVGDAIMVHLDKSKDDPQEFVVGDVTEADREVLKHLFNEEQQREWLIQYFTN